MSPSSPGTATLSPAALALLPATDASPRCAPFTESIQVDPIGTGLSVDMVLAITTPLPWPKPVFKHPWLEGITSKGHTAMGSVRVLASTPDDNNPVGTVHAWWRSGSAVNGIRLHVNSAAELQELRGELDTVAPNQSRFAQPGGVTDQAVLICTQGSHDICCGADGTRFADEATAALGPDVAVFRVSHTGGHRFAPTAMTLPDGRMWAWLTLDDLHQVLDQSGDPAQLGRQCRGWWGASRGAAQAAERAVFQQIGWTAEATDRQVTPTENENEFLVTAGEQQFLVSVTAGREIPTIACRADGGLPAKPARELQVESITAVS